MPRTDDGLVATADSRFPTWGAGSFGAFGGILRERRNERDMLRTLERVRDEAEAPVA